MEVILAKSSGFCFGVKRAVDKVYEQTDKDKKIYTYGPIIHNEEVVRDLEKKGVQVLESKEDLEALTEGSVVIRSHGVPESVYRTLEEKNIEYNKFIKDLSGASRNNTISGNSSIIYTIPINMLPRTENERSIFNQYLDSFNELDLE